MQIPVQEQRRDAGGPFLLQMAVVLHALRIVFVPRGHVAVDGLGALLPGLLHHGHRGLLQVHQPHAPVFRRVPQGRRIGAVGGHQLPFPVELPPGDGRDQHRLRPLPPGGVDIHTQVFREGDPGAGIPHGIGLFVIVGEGDDELVPPAQAQLDEVQPLFGDEALAAAAVHGAVLHIGGDAGGPQPGLQLLAPAHHGIPVTSVVRHRGIAAEEPGGHPFVRLPAVPSSQHLLHTLSVPRPARVGGG